MSTGPSRAQRRTAHIERLQALHTNADGEIDTRAVDAALAQVYLAEPDLLRDVEQAAHQDYREYREARRPFRAGPGGLQLALPLVDRLIPYGGDHEIRLGAARRQHLVAYRAILQEEMLQSQIAFVRKMTMLDEAVRRMTSDTDTFEDVMGKGYAP